MMLSRCSNVNFVSQSDGLDSERAIHFDPLAPFPHETAPQTLTRWRHWFSGMSAPAAALDLLTPAQANEVTNLPSLAAWLTGRGRILNGPASQALTPLVSRLLAHQRATQRGGHQPLPPDAWQNATLAISQDSHSWAGWHYLRAWLLAAQAHGRPRTILHQLPWHQLDPHWLQDQPQLIITNGPRLPQSTILMTHCPPHSSAALLPHLASPKHPHQMAHWQEQIALLNAEQAVAITPDGLIPVQWETNNV